MRCEELRSLKRELDNVIWTLLETALDLALAGRTMEAARLRREVAGLQGIRDTIARELERCEK